MKKHDQLNLGLDSKTRIFIIGSACLLILWSLGSSLTEAGPWSAAVITYLLYGAYWLYFALTKNPLVFRLLLIGTIAGFMELIADHYLVDTIKSLVYPENESMLWSSPLYLPFAWANIIVQLSFVGVLLNNKIGWIKASIALGIAGGMYIPLYEHLANNAGWWYYHHNTLMVLHAPVYVIMCEALISLSLPVLISMSEHNKVIRSIFLGLLLGIWIYVSAVLSWTLV